MPSRARIRGGRRGRPQRKHLLRGRQLSTSTLLDRNATTATTPTTAHPALSSSTTELNNGNSTSSNKPREERSYKDFFPNLNIKEPLAIVDVQVNNTDTTTTSTTTTTTTTTTEEQPPPQKPTSTTDQAVPTVDTPPPLANGSSSLSDTESSSTAPPPPPATTDQADQPAVEENEKQEHHHHLVDHQKEGDIYQALSTRPQAGVNNDVVNLDLLPKPAFQIVDMDTTDDTTTAATTRDTDQDVDVDGEETEKTSVGFQRPENHYIRYIGRTKKEIKERKEGERKREKARERQLWVCMCVIQDVYDWSTHLHIN